MTSSTELCVLALGWTGLGLGLLFGWTKVKVEVAGRSCYRPCSRPCSLTRGALTQILNESLVQVSPNSEHFCASMRAVQPTGQVRQQARLSQQ